MIFNAPGSTSKMGGMDSFQGLGKKLGDSASSPAVPRKISPGELALRAAEARAAQASQADTQPQPEAGPAPKPKPKISDLPPIPRVKQQVKPEEKEIKKKIKVEVIDLCTTEDEDKEAREDQARKKAEEAALWSEDELPWMKEYLEERANGGGKKKEKAPEKAMEKVKGKKRAFEGDSDADSDYLPDIDVIMKDGKEKDDKNSKEQSSKHPKKLSQTKLPKSTYLFSKDSPLAAALSDSMKVKELEKRKKKKGNKLMTDSEGENEDIEKVKVKKNVEKKKVGEKKESKEKEKAKSGGSAGKKKLLSDDSE